MRGTNLNDKHLQTEIDKLKSALNETHNETTSRNSLRWSDFTASPAPKAFIIGIVLVALNQFSGVAPMLSYTANIFEEAGSSLSPNVNNKYKFLIYC